MALFSKQNANWLIVGLGNPGSEYEATRHNAGFKAVDALGGDLGARYWKNKHGSLYAEVRRGCETLVLAKPQSFMNASGGPVKQLASSYSISPARIIVIHDEMDLEPGQVRVKKGGGHAGHNGLRSIIDNLGASDFVRVRVGIGKPPGRKEGTDHVLSRMKGQELEGFEADCVRAADAALAVVDKGADAAMNAFNAR